MSSLRPISPERFAASLERFVAFFQELREHFLEREELLAQIALALIAREHVLMTGPPGTGKSRLARAVLGRIIDARTGQPSVFARQFTESTVQTDLVGPIDFKTLMETGRTTHFTDQGMLGSVHTFLDEVFDGRDMLLRSALNVLQERELKQGPVTTKGQIECALMASNRYLSEILEGSRDTLLAFVDRIAFVGYVPKGFASREATAKVIEDQIAGVGAKPLCAQLSIQDLDVLQTAAEQVIVERAACQELASFLIRFEDEIAQVTRADPTFVPTRYLSTRTAVRLGSILKASCIYDYAFVDRERPLGVMPQDFGYLRLSMLLAGPTYESVTALLERETCPRERRQLELIRTEREAFDRCLDKVAEWVVVPRPNTQPEPEDRISLTELVHQPTAALVTYAKRLAGAIAKGELSSSDEQERLEITVYELTRRAARLGHAVGFGEQEPGQAVSALDELSGVLSTLPSVSDALVRWLREQALRILEQELRFAFSHVGELLTRMKDGLSLKQIAEASAFMVERFRAMLTRRDTLVASGAQPSADADKAWASARGELLAALRTLWEGHLQRLLTSELPDGRVDDLHTLLKRVEGAAAEIRTQDRTLRELGFEPHDLERAVLQPPLMPFLRLVLSRLDVTDRDAVSASVEGTFLELQRVGLAQVVDGQAWLGWIGEALVRQLPKPVERAKFVLTEKGYRAFRQDAARTSMSFVLRDTAIRLAFETREVQRAPRETIAGLVAKIAMPVRRKIVDGDLQRVRDTLSFLDAWWQTIRASAASSPLMDSTEFRAFLGVVHRESALCRLGLELSLIREAWPEAAVDAEMKSLEALREKLERELAALFKVHQEGVWTFLDSNPDRAKQ
jgi:MoxR-like ATPase